MRIILSLLMLLIPTLAVAQKPEKAKPAKVVTSPLPKGAHSDVTLENATAMPADTLIEPDAIYVASSAVIEVSASEDGAAHITDADGTDGVASVAVPAGATAWAAPTGKPKSTASLQSEAFTRGKGKAEWRDITAGLAGATSWAWVSTGAGLKLRFYVAAPAADSVAAPVDSAASDSAP